jgi:tight adherence protein B
MTVEPIALATFVGVVAIIVGVYWALVVRRENRDEARLKKRLKATTAGATRRRLGLIREIKRRSRVKTLDRLLTRASGIVSPLERLIEEADSGLTVGLFLLVSGSIAMSGYLVVATLTPYRAVGVLVGVLLATVPYNYLRWKRNRRLLQFEERFPEALDLIARALRAGHAFTTGLGMVAEEISGPVGSEFRILYDRQNFGMPLPDALRAFARRVPLVDARFFVTAVLTQREAGGNLSEVLENLADVVRERFKVKRHVRVVSAHARMTGWILVCLPPVTAVVLMIMVPETMRLLIEDPLGVQMIIAAVVLQVVGGLVVKKLVNIEY